MSKDCVAKNKILLSRWWELTNQLTSYRKSNLAFDLAYTISLAMRLWKRLTQNIGMTPILKN